MLPLGLSEKARHLQQVPLFSRLNRRQLEKVAGIVDQVTVPEGKRLTREGGLGYEFFIIVDGRAHVEQGGEVVNQLGAGDFFGEISLLGGRPRTATVVADSRLDLLVVHKSAFDELRRTVPGMTDRLLEAVVRRLS